MKVINLLFYLFIITVSLSCSNKVITNGGGFTDVSLNRNSSEYDIKRIGPVNVSENAFWGIPQNKIFTSRNNLGIVYRFQGYNKLKLPKIIPILSLAATSLAFGTIIVDSGLLGDISVDDYTKFTLIGSILSLPITGAVNNLMWSNSALNNSFHYLNYKLINENPEIDVFSNPKYIINNRLGFWGQRADVELNLLGSRIRTERIIIQKP